jgi:hypothetical protein
MSDSEKAPVINFECDEVTVVANGQTVYHWQPGTDEKPLQFQASPRLWIKRPHSNPGGPIGITITDDPDDPPPG